MIISQKILKQHFYNNNFINITRNLIYNIHRFIPRIFKDNNDCKTSHLIFKTINDRCNMTYKYYKNLPMTMVQRRIKIFIAKNPSLIKKLDWKKNHPLIKKYSHVPLNN